MLRFITALSLIGRIGQYTPWEHLSYVSPPSFICTDDNTLSQFASELNEILLHYIYNTLMAALIV